VLETTRAITNVAIGGNVPISNTFRLHAGFYTDRSPVEGAGESIFRAVDLTGLSAGLSFGGRLSGSIGASVSWGTTGEREIESPIGGLAATTRISVRTFNLHYALSYSF